jgi:hypothetical protein
MINTLKKNVVANLAVWFGLTALTGIVCLLWALDDTSLSRHFEAVNATVVALYPRNHQSFDYTYRVGKIIHKGHGTSGEAGIQFESVKLGDTISIHYDAKRPHNSTVASPSIRWVRAISGSIGAVVAIPFLIMGLLHHFRLLPPWKVFAPNKRK